MRWFSARQTADKGTEHEKRKYSYYKVKNFGENFPEIFIYFYIFSLKTNLGSQYSVQLSPRFVLSALFLSILPS